MSEAGSFQEFTAAVAAAHKAGASVVLEPDGRTWAEGGAGPAAAEQGRATDAGGGGARSGG